MSGRIVAYARAHRLRLALLVAVMVAIPVALTLVRDDDYESRIAIHRNVAPRTPGQPAAAQLERYIDRLIPREAVSRATALQADFPLSQESVVDNTRLESAPDGGVDLVVTSGSPTRAVSVAVLESKLVVGVAGRRRDNITARNLALTRTVRGLSDPNTSPKERQRLRVRVSTLLARLERRAPLLTTRGAAPSEPVVTGSFDKAVERLPGEFAPDPGPFVAAAAGLALALAARGARRGCYARRCAATA